MSILNNAISSIQIGIEDYKNIKKDSRRILSSIRNIYSGILLLLKHKLKELSPPNSDEVLIKEKIIPVLDQDSGALYWKGEGNKTVNVQGIKNRLKRLNISIDESSLDGLQRIRNDIEHYYIQQNESQIEEAITTAFDFIIKFCPHLQKEPIELLGQECWSIILDVSKIYKIERDDCIKSLKSCNWTYLEVENNIEKIVCSKCNSKLIKPISDEEYDPDFICRACGAELEYSEVIGSTISSFFEENSHRNIAKGGEPATDICPECNYDAFNLQERFCFACHYELEAEDCEYCGETLSFEEQTVDSVCFDCNYRNDKILAE